MYAHIDVRCTKIDLFLKSKRCTCRCRSFTPCHVHQNDACTVDKIGSDRYHSSVSCPPVCLFRCRSEERSSIIVRLASIEQGQLANYRTRQSFGWQQVTSSHAGARHCHYCTPLIAIDNVRHRCLYEDVRRRLYDRQAGVYVCAAPVMAAAVQQEGREHGCRHP